MATPVDTVFRIPPFRVLHVDLGMEYRGGQRQVLYLAREQLRAGMDVRVASPKGAPILDMAGRMGIPVVILPARYDFDPRNIFCLARACGGSDTILHTHDARGASLGALVSLARWRVCLAHTRRVSYSLGQGWSRWKYRRGHCVVCVSREVEDMVRGAGVARTRVIASTIPLERYTPRGHENGGRIGVIGALSPQKGHAQFFAALARLEKIPEVWVVGAGELESGLRAQASQLGLDGHIVWKGHVESFQVLPFLDILVVPSAHGEGSSGVIKEGWVSRVPVVCSDLPANEELVQNEVNGLVFRNGDIAHLAAQIERLRKEPALVKTLVAQGRKDVELYAPARMHELYVHAYVAFCDCGCKKNNKFVGQS